MLSLLSVRSGPENRLRHRCSSRYLRISPLHREFHSPLPTSSLPVSTAGSGLSPEFSQRTQQTAYELFTPNNSGQRLRPTCYRGCWHVVSRRFFCRYRHSRFVPAERGLQPEGLHPPRGVAASGFRPLRNIPHCCLPQESGPCLSPSVAGRALTPATRRRLGGPLPHQLADRPRAHPRPVTLSSGPHAGSREYPALAPVSGGYSRAWGRLPTCYSPVRRSVPRRVTPPRP